MKRYSLLFIAALLLTLTGAASAQTTVDPTLLDTVTESFESTRASTNLHVEMQRLTTREGGNFGGGQTQSTATWDIAQAGESWNLAGSLTTTTQFGDTPTDSTIQYVVLDGVTYLNLDGIQMGGFMGGAPGGQGTQSDTQTALTIPEGWFAVTADTNFPMAGNIDNLSAQAFGGLLFPVSIDSVTALDELPSDTIDGQPMRVIQLSVDSQAVIDSDASALLSVGGGGLGGGNMLTGAPPNAGAAQPPADAQTPPDGQTPPDMQNFQPPTLDPASIQIAFAVYIGQDDGLIHRIYSVIEIANTLQDGTTSTSTVTTIHNFSAFNQPVEITAPENGA